MCRTSEITFSSLVVRSLFHARISTLFSLASSRTYLRVFVKEGLMSVNIARSAPVRKIAAL